VVARVAIVRLARHLGRWWLRLPNVTWVALSPAHDFRALDASHGLERTRRIRTLEQAALYNLPIGSELLRDVGWQLPSSHRWPWCM